MGDNFNNNDYGQNDLNNPNENQYKNHPYDEKKSDKQQQNNLFTETQAGQQQENMQAGQYQQNGTQAGYQQQNNSQAGYYQQIGTQAGYQQQNNSQTGHQQQGYQGAQYQQGYQQNNQQNSQQYYQYQQPQYKGQSQYNGQHQYQGSNYGYQPYGNNYNQQGKGVAIASMVCGIVSLCLCCCFYYVSLPAAIVGLILGIVSLKKNYAGRGMAIAGVVTSSITIFLAILMMVGCSALYSRLLNEMTNSIYNDSFYY